MSDDELTTRVTQGLEEARRLGRLRRIAWAAAAVGLAAVVGAVTASMLPTLGPWAVAAVAGGGLALAAVQALRLQRLSDTAANLGACAQLDPETGLPGPVALERELLRAMEAAQRLRAPLAVVMVSFDDLRPLHLDRGISAGRRLLRQTAGALASTVGPYGGHAFRAHAGALVAVLPGTTHAEAEKLALKVSPSLALLSRKNGNLVRVVAGGAVALPGDLPEEFVLRAEKRCARLRNGSAEDVAAVLRPMPTPTH